MNTNITITTRAYTAPYAAPVAITATAAPYITFTTTTERIRAAHIRRAAVAAAFRAHLSAAPVSAPVSDDAARARLDAVVSHDLIVDGAVKYRLDNDHCAIITGDVKTKRDGDFYSLACWYTKTAIKSIIRHGAVNSYYAVELSRALPAINTAAIIGNGAELPADIADYVQDTAAALIENGEQYGGKNARRIACNRLYRTLYTAGRLTTKKAAAHDAVELSDDIPAPVTAADRDQISPDCRRLVNAALNAVGKVGSTARRDFIAVKVNGMKYAERAADTGRKLTAVTTSVSKSQKRVNAFFAENAAAVRAFFNRAPRREFFIDAARRVVNPALYNYRFISDGDGVLFAVGDATPGYSRADAAARAARDAARARSIIKHYIAPFAAPVPAAIDAARARFDAAADTVARDAARAAFRCPRARIDAAAVARYHRARDAAADAARAAERAAAVRKSYFDIARAAERAAAENAARARDNDTAAVDAARRAADYLITAARARERAAVVR